MRHFSTLDFTILDENNLMAFLHVAGRLILNQSDSMFFDVFRKLKFKMKIGYECLK